MIEICYYLDKKEELLKFVELSRNRIFLDKISENQRYKFIKTMPKEMIYELDNIKLKIESSTNEKLIYLQAIRLLRGRFH